MINDAQVFLSGYVAREPRFRITANGISNLSMRVAYTPRRVDRDTGEWTDGTTSFVSVVCWRTLADNVAKCLHKGEPVVVKGRLQVRPYEKDGVSRLAVEVEATSVGHDLAHGVATFQRPRRLARTAAARRWLRSLAATEPYRGWPHRTGPGNPQDCPPRSEAATRLDPRNCLSGRSLGPTLLPSVIVRPLLDTECDRNAGGACLRQ